MRQRYIPGAAQNRSNGHSSSSIGNPHLDQWSGFCVLLHPAVNDGFARSYNASLRSRSAFVITDTELNVMATLAIIGLSRRPKKGYKTPAATGTPTTL